MIEINLKKDPPPPEEDPSNPENKYTWMQKSQYNHLSSLHWMRDYDAQGHLIKDPVDGWYHAHCEWPGYELLFEGFENLDRKTALDFGCGLGKNIEVYHKQFKQIDGVDLCPRILDLAKENLKYVYNCKLLSCNGIDLADIPDNSYDLVISTRCLQHIAIYSIRYNLFKEFYRVLKPGGWISVQMLLGKSRMPEIGYYRNLWHASGTNGRWDVMIRRPEYIERDLTSYVGLDYANFSYKIRLAPPKAICKDRFWIFFKAQKPFVDEKIHIDCDRPAYSMA